MTPPSSSAAGLLAARLRTQRLAANPADSPTEAVSHLLAVQAQDYTPGLWSVSMRAGDPPGSEVQAALDRGEILRVHVLRPTWHLVAAEDLGWLQAVTGPRVRARNSSFYRRLGIDDDALAASRRLILAALAGGNELTMAELGDVLTAGGMELRNLHLVHFVMDIELRGEICSGPRHGKQHSYMRTVDRIAGAPVLDEIDRDDALVRLVERYVAGHGPATIKDLQAWSSLTLAQLRGAVADLGSALQSRDVDGRTYYTCRHRAGAADAGDGAPALDVCGRAGSTADEPRLWLLPQFDELAIGYRESRDLLGAEAFVSQVNPEHRDYVNPIVTPQGIAGWWRPRARAKTVDFDVTASAPGAIDSGALAAAQDRYRAFRLG